MSDITRSSDSAVSGGNSNGEHSHVDTSNWCDAPFRCSTCGSAGGQAAGVADMQERLRLVMA